MTRRDQLVGLVIGGALGDALGLPSEGLSPRRQQTLLPSDLEHAFFLGRGMVSDDTEHAFMTAQALLAAQGNVDLFRRSLGRQLRWWFLGLPAGVGLATARACLRLWLGVPPDLSGVHSAGNGPAMRSAILGAVFADDAARRREFVRASTRLTHVDPRAETAALAVAEVAAWIVRRGAGDGVEWEVRSKPPQVGFGDGVIRCVQVSQNPEWVSVCAALESALIRGDAVTDFATSLGLTRGVTGYAYHTVPVALYAWLRHRGDFHATLVAAIRCGGDTDTVAAIAGALAGCEVGEQGIPAHWRDGLQDWPRSPGLLKRLAGHLAETNGRPVRWFWPGVLPRNLFFLGVVLFHGLRRLLPPY